ncbi:hypothetical protein QYF36_020584 [Acer negundo]|nr:hypothetical protein QYF36_020584 [Acer negundo]
MNLSPRKTWYWRYVMSDILATLDRRHRLAVLVEEAIGKKTVAAARLESRQIEHETTTVRMEKIENDDGHRKKS